MHRSRGRKAVDDFGVLPGYTGTLVRDALSVYDSVTLLVTPRDGVPVAGPGMILSTLST